MRNLLIGAALLMGAGAAQAITVDFNELAPNSFHGSPLESGGLIFSNPGYGVAGEAFITSTINGETALLPNAYDSVTTITTTDGTPFFLHSLDFADPFDFADDPVQLTLTFHTVSNSFSEVRIADFLPGLQTEIYSVADILSIDVFASGSDYGDNSFLLKNIVYSTGDPTSAVPEPATWGLLLLGFGMVGFNLRQQRKVRLS